MQCSRTVETWTVSRALRRLFDEDYDQQKRQPARNEWRATDMLTESWMRVQDPGAATGTATESDVKWAPSGRNVTWPACCHCSAVYMAGCLVTRRATLVSSISFPVQHVSMFQPENIFGEAPRLLTSY